MEQILRLIEHYGYLVVFFGVMMESTGVPLPGETILLASGFLAQRGHLDVGDAILFGILGAVAGDQLGYWVGRKEDARSCCAGGATSGLPPSASPRGGILRPPRGESRIPGPLLLGPPGIRGSGGGHKPDALGDLHPLQRTRRDRLGDCRGPGRLPRGREHLARGAVAGTGHAAGRPRRRGGRPVPPIPLGARALLASYGEAARSYPPVARLGARYKVQLSWLLRRLTPGQYLGLHLTLGLAAAAGCLWLFGGLAEDVLTNDPIVRYDRTIAAYLHSLANPLLTTFFLIVTALGSIETLALVGVVVAAILAWRRQWLYLWTWAAAVGGSALLNHLIKDLFARPRPSFEHPLLLETSYSFPSGHAMESFVVYGMLAYFAVLTLRVGARGPPRYSARRSW